MTLTTIYFILLVVFIILALSTALAGVAFLIFGKKQLAQSLNMRTYLVTLQKEIAENSEEARKQPAEIIAVAEQFYVSLSMLRRKKSWFEPKPHIAIEIAACYKDIKFYLAVPDSLADLIEKQLNAVYPKASIEPVQEYTVFQPQSEVVTAQLRFREAYYFPIRTFYALQTDPLNNITNALSKLGENEGAVVQYIIRPGAKKWTHEGPKIAREMAQGKSYKDVAGSFFWKLFRTVGKETGKAAGSVLSAGRNSENQRYAEKPVILSPTEQRQMEALQGKVSKQNFEVNVRIVVASDTTEQARHALEQILAAYHEFDDPDLNGFEHKIMRSKNEIISFIFRYFDRRARLILNSEELTSIIHFPNHYVETPNIHWLTAQRAPAPPNTSADGLLLGRNVYRGVARDIFIAPDDRRRHMYIIGKTGTGKSTMLENLIVQDIRNGHGVGVVDPHGELIENILPFIPKERAEDVILFDPGATDRPMGLNMLEYRTTEQKDFAVDEMIAIFHKLFPPEMIGPIFEHNMRNVMLTLMEDTENPGTIAEIPRMFTDDAFQKSKVAKLKDPVVRAFWEKEMAKTSDFHKSETLGYLVSKVGQFVENRLMRNIIGQPKSAFDIRDVMDSGKILLVNLSKGKVGELNSSLLGLIIVSKIQMAAMTRVTMEEEQRRDFHLYLDEFQNVTTDSIATILSEARKYHLTLTIAHQFIAQLDEKIRDAVFGNVGTMMTYRIGPADAEFVVKQYEPVFTPTDLVNIDKYNCYVKMIIDGAPSRAFSLEASAPPRLSHPDWYNPRLASAIRELSHLKYGRSRDVVEADILERTRMGL